MGKIGRDKNKHFDICFGYFVVESNDLLGNGPDLPVQQRTGDLFYLKLTLYCEHMEKNETELIFTHFWGEDKVLK